ncbi:LAS superfamily LD-carboxypeptidase LdcB [Crossiella equi]|uniref:LAS superfamily LD-carboxypeptidase LdcB n=1 Tax=Crossiella equi TaxID=130796 RepID=A0ABS5AHV2_9PSEU|nr:D-alanyl-D-alanine carboxypeptidase family protein [Crossiella equi]MBP2475947.1 LAS superfamily LD-carboxypeptidase LdcB [Crossiella equi]
MRRKIIGLALALGLAGALVGVLGSTGVWEDATEWAGPDESAATGSSAATTSATVPAVVRVDPPPLPEQPKPKLNKDGKPICADDPSFFDKPVDDLKKEAAQAWREARAAGWQAGLTLCVEEGKRTVAQQQAQFDAAVAQHGSEAKARQYVLPPSQSLHVQGWAVDVQPRASAAWLERTKGELGWCRRYANEPWHFEYKASYRSQGCPELLPHP